jgi:hypothetical protein
MTLILYVRFHSEVTTPLHLVVSHLFFTCRVVDSDGEFLLIEAAEYLPDWANPETCEQRVGIFFMLSDNKQETRTFSVITTYLMNLMVILFILFLE